MIAEALRPRRNCLQHRAAARSGSAASRGSFRAGSGKRWRAAAGYWRFAPKTARPWTTAGLDPGRALKREIRRLDSAALPCSVRRHEDFVERLPVPQSDASRPAGNPDRVRSRGSFRRREVRHARSQSRSKTTKTPRTCGDRRAWLTPRRKTRFAWMPRASTP